jgi:hypothetical protein
MKELKFASTEVALQHLANVMGKRVAVSENAEEQLWYLIKLGLKELIDNGFKQAKRDKIDEYMRCYSSSS